MHLVIFYEINNKIVPYFTYIVCTASNIHTYYRVYIQKQALYGQIKDILRAILTNVMLGLHNVFGIQLPYSMGLLRIDPLVLRVYCRHINMTVARTLTLTNNSVIYIFASIALSM